jgi:hypothetical protein
MTGPSAPTPQPPSAKRLLRSTAIAAVVAAAILVTIVLPAEYGIDPTGIGRVLGLKEMGEIKMELAQQARDEAAAVAARAASTPPVAATSPQSQSHVTDVILPPTQGKEIKLAMLKDARATYSWTTNRGVVNYDTHGDAPGIQYHGYAKGTGVKADSGSLTAAFAGDHGWFWRNRGADTVILTLRTNGNYQALKRLP